MASLLAVAAVAAPIPDPVPTTLPHYQGAPAKARVFPATKAPQNPHLARDPRSNIHNDSWMTDAYRRPGPLGNNSRAVSGAMPPAVCGSLAFHSRGFLVSVCPSVIAPPQARVIDPDTLEILAAYDMPDAPAPPGTKPYQDFAGGGYFFLDRQRPHLERDEDRPPGRAPGLPRRARDHEDRGLRLRGWEERISSALPDFKGRIWFVTKQRGEVGILNPRTRRIRSIRLDEEIQNSFAVDRDAVYVVSSRRMYRFSVRRGRPHEDWSRRYRNSGIVKPGQADAGSGTTPTIMRGGYVAITDNADPMNVVVYGSAPVAASARRRCSRAARARPRTR